MGAGASSSTAKTRKDYVEELLNLNEVSDALTFVIDQGGGSFSAYLFSGTTTIKRLKSSKYKDKDGKYLTEDGVLNTLKSKCGFDLVNGSDGTFNDYSGEDVLFYPHICEALVAAYKKTFAEACQLLKIPPQSVTRKFIRQTGKIRAKLHEPKNNVMLKKWNFAFNNALKAAGCEDWDYQLLSNDNEAYLEAGAFFEMNESTDHSYVGVGIGSSSTQAYGHRNNKHYQMFDSVCGAKQTSEQLKKPGGKAIEAWTEQFDKLLRPLFATDDQNTLVLMNAIGFIFIPMTAAEEEVKERNEKGEKVIKMSPLKHYEGKEEFTKKIKNGESMSPDELMGYVSGYRETRAEKHWGADMLFGMCKSIKSIHRIKRVFCERKGSVGKSLPYETSWVKYMVLTSLTKMKQEKKALLNKQLKITSELTSEERDRYLSEIATKQKWILGNVTQKITEKQVAVLAGSLYEERILKDGTKSPKELFDELKSDDKEVGQSITRAQWLEHCSAIASLD